MKKRRSTSSCRGTWGARTRAARDFVHEAFPVSMGAGRVSGAVQPATFCAWGHRAVIIAVPGRRQCKTGLSGTGRRRASFHQAPSCRGPPPFPPSPSDTPAHHEEDVDAEVHLPGGDVFTGPDAVPQRQLHRHHAHAVHQQPGRDQLDPCRSGATQIRKRGAVGRRGGQPEFSPEIAPEKYRAPIEGKKE